MSERVVLPVSALALILLASVANGAGPGLIGWWKFDGDALDSSGNAHHGTLHVAYSARLGTRISAQMGATWVINSSVYYDAVN